MKLDICFDFCFTPSFDPSFVANRHHNKEAYSRLSSKAHTMQNIPPSPSPPPLVTTPSSESSSSSSSSESEDNNAQINFFDHIPTEIRVAIFKDALKEPGLQFLGIFSYHPDGTTLSVRGPNQLCKEQEYPSGCFSVYRKREFISQTCRVARETYDIVCESFIRPQSFLVEVGPPMMSVTREAIYDKAIDVAYIKFGKWPLWTQQPSLRSAPPGWVQRAVEFYALEGIARIAIEVPRPVWRPCRYVPRTKSQARGSGRGCALCGLRHAEHVNASVKLELENYCRFLRRLSDIEEVLLVLCNPPHRLDFTPSQRQYIATGTPVVDGPVAAATEEKFANGKGTFA